MGELPRAQPLVHIGYHKTGTTWLQNHVFVPERGYQAPWTVRSGEAIEHLVLSNEFRFQPETVRSAFQTALDPAAGQVPVISHEDLCGYPVLHRYYGASVARRLHAVFPGARILMVVREQRSALLSLYRQYIKQGGQWPLAVFIGSGAERPGFRPICRLDHLEYHLLVEHYQALFGPEQVLVLPYEWLREDPLGFENAIHDFVANPTRATEHLPAANVGEGGVALAGRRIFNRFYQRSPLWNGHWQSLPLGYRAGNKACQWLNRAVPRRWHQRVETALRAQINDRVGDYYRESNQRLASLMGRDLSRWDYRL